MYSRKKLEKRFKNTIFRFGFENTEDSVGPHIAFGHGWGKAHLYMILITPGQVKYEFSDAFNGRNDISKTVPYRENFYIPKTERDFINFISK